MRGQATAMQLLPVQEVKSLKGQVTFPCCGNFPESSHSLTSKCPSKTGKAVTSSQRLILADCGMSFFCPGGVGGVRICMLSLPFNVPNSLLQLSPNFVVITFVYNFLDLLVLPLYSIFSTQRPKCFVSIEGRCCHSVCCSKFSLPSSK